MLKARSFTALALLCGSCASAPKPQTAPAVAAAPTPPTVAVADVVEGPPATWAAALARFSSTCPVPFFTLAQPEHITVGTTTFTLAGSTLTRDGGRWSGPLKLGVLGAIKDADDDTRENLRVAMKAFKKAGVQFVVANGDLVGNETATLLPVVQMLGEEVDLPLFAHSGNYEWTSAFTETFTDAAKKWPQLFNMNVIRDVDFGGVHLVSLPGYFNRRFLQPGACHYGEGDVAEATRFTSELARRGEVVVLTSHGPPLGRGAAALDVTNDGENVGDPQLNAMLTDGGVSFGLFSHILEAGGRAVDDVDGTSNVSLPMKGARKKLYVNVGGASSFGWGMLSGKTSRGLAAMFTLDPAGGGEARVEFITLR